MPVYNVKYKIEIEGELEVAADSEESAENIVEGFNMTKLLDNATSEDVNIEGAELVESEEST